MTAGSSFYELCIEVSDAMFPEFDAICLRCGGRIGSHGVKEFERCAKAYFEEHPEADPNQSKLEDYA